LAHDNRMYAFTQEELDEIKACLQVAIDEHGEAVAALTGDDSTDAEEFRTAVADEYKRQTLRVRLLAMLKGGE
jgi:hypothetical protein